MRERVHLAAVLELDARVLETGELQELRQLGVKALFLHQVGGDAAVQMPPVRRLSVCQLPQGGLVPEHLRFGLSIRAPGQFHQALVQQVAQPREELRILLRQRLQEVRVKFVANAVARVFQEPSASLFEAEHGGEVAAIPPPTQFPGRKSLADAVLGPVIADDDGPAHLPGRPPVVRQFRRQGRSRAAEGGSRGPGHAH